MAQSIGVKMEGFDQKILDTVVEGFVWIESGVSRSKDDETQRVKYKTTVKNTVKELIGFGVKDRNITFQARFRKAKSNPEVHEIAKRGGFIWGAPAVHDITTLSTGDLIEELRRRGMDEEAIARIEASVK